MQDEGANELSVPAFVRGAARRHGPRPLIVASGRRLGYGEAEARSRRLALGLLAAGVGKGTRVGVLLPNGVDWVVAWLAAARIGAVVVPINTFARARELRHVLRHADVAELLTCARFLRHDYLARLEEAAPELEGRRGDRPLRLATLPYLRRVWVWEEGGAPAWSSGDRAELERLGAKAPGVDERLLEEVEREVRPADWLTIVYSSGSSGAPKGVVHSHGAVLRHGRAMRRVYGLAPEDRLYSPMPFFWVGGFVVSLLAPMSAGSCLLTEDHFEPGRTLDLLESERATVVIGWPHFAKSMAEHPSFPRRDLSSIRRGSLWDLVPDRLRPRDPQLRSGSLGMTETCGPHTVGDSREDLPERLRGAFGRAVPGVEHKIVDPESGATLPPGELGEICVRGYSLMQALYKVEREQAFDRDGFYHTGDSGFFTEDGWLFFRGRLGEIIKTAGANVAPAEVEAVLAERPEVSEAYVAGIPDRERGELVAAAVVPRPGCAVDAEALRRELAGELASYKVPRFVLVCAKEELPFTDSGKIRRRELSALLAQRAAAASPSS